MRRKEPGMKINRVTLYNFSSYVGENTIALDTHGVQNIILIGGNNGAGKTSVALQKNWKDFDFKMKKK